MFTIKENGMNGRDALRMVIMIMLAAACFGLGTAAAQTAVFDPTLVGSPDETKKVEWHGYYEFEYWDVEEKNTTFDAHKITVWMGVRLSDRAYLSSEVEYEHDPKIEPGKDRPGGSGAIKVDSAQLRLTPFEGSAVYMGVFYVPFGIEYLSYPGHKNKLVTRPKVMKGGGVIPGTWSDVGIGMNVAFSGFGQADLYYVNGDAASGGVSRDSSSGGNDDKSAGARLMIDGLLDGFNAGFSAVTGQWDEAADFESTRYGAHIRMDTDTIFGVSWAPVLIAEYIAGVDEAASAVDALDRKVEGYYAQISSRVFEDIEIVARYGEYDNDKEAADNKRRETSAGVVWHLLENVQVKGEYQWNTEEGTEVDNNAAVAQVVAHW